MDKWEYLITPEYSVRHRIAEYFVDSFDLVIDIGTYKKELNINSKLHSIDPLKTLPNTFHGTVFEWFKTYNEELIDTNYAVVILGCHIEGDDDEISTVINLIYNSKISVIEFPIDHQPSLNQFNTILFKSGKKIIHKIDFTFPLVGTPGFPELYNKRVLYTLGG